jgi:hypothetical protein
LKWQWQIPDPDNGVGPAPMVCDLNQDGQPEIVLITRLGALHVRDGATGGPATFFTSPTSTTFDYQTSVAVGRIDSDGFPDIVAVSTPSGFVNVKKVVALDRAGQTIWDTELNAWPTNSFQTAIADLDQDGDPEVIAGGRVLSSTGTVEFALPGIPGTTDGWGPVVADLDLDGSLEIIAGNLAYNSDGSNHWVNSNATPGLNAAVQFDNDPNPEIVHVNGVTDTLVIYEHNGAEKWSVLLQSPSHASVPVVADLDGDGAPEVGVVSNYLYSVFNHDGTLKWSKSTLEQGGANGSTAFDFNNDGIWEIVYADGQTIKILSGGTALWETTFNHGTGKEYPIVADVDADGHADIVVLDEDSLRVFENANNDWPSTRSIWNQHAYFSANVSDDGSIPQTLPANWWQANQFRVNPQPGPIFFGTVDLTASYIRVTQYPSSAVLTVRIGNGGEAAAAAGTSVSFYDGDPGAGGTLLGTATLAADLLPGAFVDVSYTWSNAPVGAHNIHVVADRNGTGVQAYVECDELNNKHNFAIAIEAGADLKIAKAASAATMPAGSTQFYRLQVTNLSTTDSGPGTVVADTLPAALNASNITVTAPAGWTCVVTGLTITCTRATAMAAGAFANIVISFTVGNVLSGSVTNTAQLTNSLDPNIGNNTSQHTATLIAVTQTPLVITSPVGTSTFTPGQAVPITWTGGPTGGPVCINVVQVSPNVGLPPQICGLPNTGSANFTLPATLECETQYQFYVLPEGQGNPPLYYGYSGIFTIPCTPVLVCCVKPPSKMKFWLAYDGSYVDKVANLTGVPTATVSAAASVPPGHSGSALALDSSGRIDFAANAALDFGIGDFSIDAWVRMPESVFHLHPLIDNRSGSGSNIQGIQLFVYQGKVGFQMADGVGAVGYDNFMSASNIVDGNWHHVAVTVRRNTAAGGVIYVDGDVVLTFDPTTRTGSLGIGQPLVIGHSLDPPGPGRAGKPFEIDEIEIFGRALKPEEVLALSQNPKCKP